MNNCTFLGYLGRDAEVTYTNKGTAMCSFPLAIKSGYGEYERTTWLRCTFFGKRAENPKLMELLKKGTSVVVSGEISLYKFTGNDGSQVASLELAVRDLHIASTKRDRDRQGGGNYSQPQQQMPQQAPQQMPQQQMPQQQMPQQQMPQQQMPQQAPQQMPQQMPQQEPNFAEQAGGGVEGDDDIPF